MEEVAFCVVYFCGHLGRVADAFARHAGGFVVIVGRGAVDADGRHFCAKRRREIAKGPPVFVWLIHRCLSQSASVMVNSRDPFISVTSTVWLGVMVTYNGNIEGGAAEMAAPLCMSAFP